MEGYSFTDWNDFEGKAKAAAKRLRMNKCACGGRKGTGHAFCAECFNSLPAELRSSLRCMLKRSYVANEIKAIDFLAAKKATATEPVSA